MPVPAGGVTRWFRDTNGRISQIDRVTQITIATPLIANGYYRDSPPIVNGGAGVLEQTFTGQSVAVAGGSTQTITDVGGTAIKIVAPSSVLQDDAFTHTDLRFIWSPVPLVFFKTADALTASNPDDSTFSKTRPIGTFDTFDVDCVFYFNEDCEIFNSAPPGWEPGSDGS